MQDFPSLVPSEVCSPNERTVGCDIAETILSWIDSVLTILLIGGICIMCIGSLGNRVNASRTTVLISVLPVLYFFIKSFTPIGTEPGDFAGEYHRQFALALSMAIAVLIMFERMRQILYLSGTKRLFSNCSSKLAQFSCCGISGTVFHRSVETASSYKMDRMLHNAIDIATSAKGKKHKSALDVFYESNDVLEKVGGHMWVWKRMKNKALFLNEGIRFSTRLLAANMMQFGIIVYIILFMMASTERLIEGYEGNTVIILVRSAQSVATKMVDSLQDLPALASAAIAAIFQAVLPTIDLLRIDACEALAINSDMDIPEVCYSNYTLLNDLHSQSDDFVSLIISSMSQQMSPVKNFLKSAIDVGADMLADAAVVVDPLQPWMIQMAMGVGGLVAFAASILLATLYLPSVVSTTLRFRCGALPTLDADSKQFSNLYRSKLHRITFLTGYVSSNAFRVILF
jgi:hypothetical protein